jgi:hypothetical protein
MWQRRNNFVLDEEPEIKIKGVKLCDYGGHPKRYDHAVIMQQSADMLEKSCLLPQCLATAGV